MTVRKTMLIVTALVLGACGSSQSTSRSTTTVTHRHTSRHVAPGTGPTQPGGGTFGPEGIPIEEGVSLAPASSTVPGKPVDGIACSPSEQVVYHIHAHLQVYVDGLPRQLPGGIGIVAPVAEQTAEGPVYGATRCYYWLHTHAADGIIHVESPTRRIYTLGNFFDLWRQPLSSRAVAGARGQVTAIVNGRRWTKSPRGIPLLPHEVIQLEVGKPAVAFHSVSFNGTGL